MQGFLSVNLEFGYILLKVGKVFSGVDEDVMLQDSVWCRPWYFRRQAMAKTWCWPHWLLQLWLHWEQLETVLPATGAIFEALWVCYASLVSMSGNLAVFSSHMAVLDVQTVCNEEIRGSIFEPIVLRWGFFWLTVVISTVGCLLPGTATAGSNHAEQNPCVWKWTIRAG